MTVSKAQMAATKRFEDKNYDKALIRLPKGKKAEIQTAAEKQGESLNAYVIGAVERRMKAEQEESSE
ncbi:MAG: toxin-antitoxin system HicB family antitoxin [Oscillospiraceae bacterium]